jgi:hypothetical protein
MLINQTDRGDKTMTQQLTLQAAQAGLEFIGVLENNEQMIAKRALRKSLYFLSNQGNVYRISPDGTGPSINKVPEMNNLSINEFHKFQAWNIEFAFMRKAGIRVYNF